VLRSDTVAVNTTSLLIRFNNDSGANYDTQLLLGNAATVTASETFAATSAAARSSCPPRRPPPGVAAMGTLVIPDYIDTNWNKVGLLTQAHKGGTSTGTIVQYNEAIFWRSSAAINRITLTPGAGAWAANSRVTLWGLPA
jgi:hypothetical protein